MTQKFICVVYLFIVYPILVLNSNTYTYKFYFTTIAHL